MSQTSRSADRLQGAGPFKETLAMFGQRFLVFVAVVGIGLLPLAMLSLLRDTSLVLPVFISLLFVLGLPVVIWVIIQTTQLVGSHSIKTAPPRRFYGDAGLQASIDKKLQKLETLKEEVEESLSNYEARPRQTEEYLKAAIGDVYAGMEEVLLMLSLKGALSTEDLDERESVLLLQNTPFLIHPDSRERWRAYASLIALGTPQALELIKVALRTETDSKIIALAREKGLVGA